MQELNAVLLIAVIFVPSQFLLASALFPPMLIRHAASLVPKPRYKLQETN